MTGRVAAGFPERAPIGLPSFLIGRPRPYLIAHRGAATLAPENSLAAFRLALEAGADAVETDLWFSRDGTLVCHHDPDLGRMAGFGARIDQLTWAQLRRVDLGGGGASMGHGHPVPSLDDLLVLMPADRLLVLELKDPRFAEAEWAARLAEQIGPRIAASNVVAVSSEPRLLSSVKRADPRLATGHIAMRALIPGRATELLGPYWPLLVLNPWYVRVAHRRGQWVAPLDPKLHRRLARYLRLGVDAVLTGDVGATRARIEELRG